jgi:hypothetical protein
MGYTHLFGVAVVWSRVGVEPWRCTIVRPVSELRRPSPKKSVDPPSQFHQEQSTILRKKSPPTITSGVVSLGEELNHLTYRVIPWASQVYFFSIGS